MANEQHLMGMGMAANPGGNARTGQRRPQGDAPTCSATNRRQDGRRISGRAESQSVAVDFARNEPTRTIQPSNNQRRIPIRAGNQQVNSIEKISPLPEFLDLTFSFVFASRTPRFYAPLGRSSGGGGGGGGGQKTAMSRTMSYGSRVSSGVAPPQHPQQQQRSQSFASDSLRQNLERSLYLDFDGRGDAGSPSSDNILFDHHLCYATTPSSSNGNSDMEGNNPLPPPPPMAGGARSGGGGGGSANPNQQGSVATSPTSRLLLEYEMHLRNTLAKGMDAESCSLHTFEALLSQSMEDLGKIFCPILIPSLLLFSSSFRFFFSFNPAAAAAGFLTVIIFVSFFFFRFVFLVYSAITLMIDVSICAGVVPCAIAVCVCVHNCYLLLTHTHILLLLHRGGDDVVVHPCDPSIHHM